MSSPSSLKSDEDKHIEVTSNAKNAREAISKLLATVTSPGSYCTGGTLAGNIRAPTIRLISSDKKRSGPINFPLSKEDINQIKSHAEPADVGMRGPNGDGRNGINLDVRKSWQISPQGIELEGTRQTRRQVLEAINKELGTATEYQVEMQLYKFLFYEPGCFFLKHRDTERLRGMFGTLVVELPSDGYEGAELKIWSPLKSDETSIFSFGGEENAKKMKYVAFYSDCNHEVTKLEQGHRCVLIYHLTARPRTRDEKYSHLPPVPALPPQPADESTVIEIAKCMKAFAAEPDDAYPNDAKPQKFVLVLSHRYTPAAFEEDGWQALKGTDRSIAELIRAAASHGRSESPTATSTFEAFLALALIYDRGELTYENSATTTGPLIPLIEGCPPLFGGSSDETDFHPSWFEHGEEYWGPPMDPENPLPGDMEYWEEHGDLHGCYHCPFSKKPGKHSLKIVEKDLLLASGDEYLNDDGDDTDGLFIQDRHEGGIEKVEFLGNCLPYEGRVYSRAVIVLWPTKHRSKIEQNA